MAAPQDGISRIVAATDRTRSGDRAAEVAAGIAEPLGAELVLLQIVVPEGAPASHPEPSASPPPSATDAERAQADLAALAERLAGARGRALVVTDIDPAGAIVREAREAGADLLVVGNYGMTGRREFLLKNVPNRVSHTARCSVLIVNTSPAVEAEAAVALGEQEETPPDDRELLGRAVHIARTMQKHGIRQAFSRARPGVAPDAAVLGERADKLRAALQELGPAFGKLGQVLSTRPDLLPAPFVEALSSLQSHVPPMTQAEVVGVMEQELGVPWEDVFATLDPEPIAAGTMAQVHAATLSNGDQVVVKVQRPAARRELQLDLGLLERFAGEIAQRPLLNEVIDLPAVVEALTEALHGEMDFRQEAENLQHMREVLAGYSRLEVPKLYEEYSSDRLLVMEAIRGTRVTEAPEGEARKEAARQLLESYYRQILGAGFFHADPHPGNLQWWNDKVYLLDLGLVGRLEPETRELLTVLLLAFAQNDVAFLADVVLMLAGQAGRADLDEEGFRSELAGLVSRYRGRSLKEIQLGPLLQEMTEIAMRYQVRLPASLTLTGKALGQVQLSIAALDPTLDPLQVAGSYVMGQVTERAGAALSPANLVYRIRKAALRVSKLGEAVERIAGTRPGSRLGVRFEGLEPVEGSIRRAGRHLSLALVSLGLLVAWAVTVRAGGTAGWLPPVLGGGGGLMTAVLVADLIRTRGRPGGRRRPSP